MKTKKIKVTPPLSTVKVESFAKKKGTITTAQVASQFKVSKAKAAAAIAVLRRSVLEPADPPKTRTGVSRWTYVG